MKMRAWRLVAPILSASLLLTACGGGSGGGSPDQPAPQPQSLGLMKITVSGLGTGNMTSQAELLSSGGSGPQPRVINIMPNGIDVKQIAASHVDVGTRGAGGMRYFNVVYSVRNAQFCGTPGSCTAYTSAHQNITFIGAATSSNIANTAIVQLSRFDGTVDTASIAQEILPTHGAILNGGGTGVLVQPGYESMQVYSEAEIAAIPLDTGATGLFPYGYVVKNVNTSSSRTLPANPAANQYDGQLAFSFKLPLQPVQADDPYSIVFIFQVIEDTNTRVTQSVEEQTLAGDAVATARAAALGGTDLAVLGGRVAQTNIADPICTVRTAGAAGSAQAYLVNNGNNPTLAGAPYNLESVPAGRAINGGFCTDMNAAAFGTLVVSGSQSGTRTAAGVYTGTYAGGASNQLSFTPDAAHPFFPGETVSFSYTTGLTSSTGSLPLTQAFVGSYRVGQSVVASGTFGKATNVTVGSAPNSVAIGDFNGDGKLDLAVVNTVDNTVSVLLNNGSGGFLAPTTLTVGSNLNGGGFAIVAADFNGDGKLDLAVADQGNGDVAIFTGNGSGGFTGPVTITVGNSPESLAVGDFNGDGKPDLAVANTADDTVWILLNNGSGSMVHTNTLSLATGAGPFAVAAGDFNGDGRLDVVAADGGTNDVTVFLSNGTGGFGTGTTYTVGTGSFNTPDSIAVGDFNGDGVSDLLVGNSGDGSVSLLLGNGSGGFAAPARTSVGSGVNSNPYYVIAGDFNGDGKLDAAVANNADGTVSVLIGNGSGGFAAPVNYGSGSTANPNPSSVFAGDINGDGRLDLVVTNFGETDISILLGQPGL